jgi:ribosome-associated protein
MIQINDNIAIPDDELQFTASLSSGPGGQNVNKVSSRVTLWFDVTNSPNLSQEQKELLMRRLKSRVSKAGILRVTSQETPSQAANRNFATERFVELLRDALRQVPKRKKTRVSRVAKLRRLEEKKQHSSQKRERSKKVPFED